MSDGKNQSLPYGTRVKMFWAIFILVAVGLTYLIIQSIKSTIINAGGNLTKIENTKSEQSPIDFASVERVEISDTGLKIYFNFYNPTSDILNISKLADIRLRTGNITMNAQKVTDRQGKTFVQKVLSRTQNFGIVYFPNPETSEADLIFDDMSLERNFTSLFQQTIKLKFDELNKPSNVRK